MSKKLLLVLVLVLVLVLAPFAPAAPQTLYRDPATALIISGSNGDAPLKYRHGQLFSDGLAVDEQLAAKALDTAVVHKTGNETIGGTKTFSAAPVVPSNSFPESAITSLLSDLNAINAALATKAADNAVVHLTGNETIAGVKSFSSAPVVPSNSFPESATANLVSDLAGKEPTIAAGTTAQFWRGDKSWQTLNTAVVPESGSLYFTNARAIAAPLTGYAAGAGTISATDSILVAIQKNAGNLAALVLPATSTAAASNWIRSYDAATGLFTKSQPTFSDISGTLSGSSVSGGTFGPVNGSALTSLTAANITASTTVGRNLLNLTNPGAITFLQINADNSVTAQSASAQRTALGLDIGTNVQAWDADLDTYSANTPTTTGLNLVKLANPGAISFIKIASDNSVSTRTAAQFIADLDADLTTWAGITPGTGVAAALAINVGSAGAFITSGGALGTPSSGTLTNATGLPISSGVSGLGSGVAAFLATPSGANFAAALTSAVPVSKGGTGATTLTAHGVLIGNGTSAVNVTSAGTAGQVLTSNGASADPTFQAGGITTAKSILSISGRIPGGNAAFADNTTFYTSFGVPADSFEDSHEETVHFIPPFAGTLRNLKVRTGRVPSGSTSGNTVITVRKNGADTVLSVALPTAATTTASDATHSVTFNGTTDTITLSIVSGAGNDGAISAELASITVECDAP